MNTHIKLHTHILQIDFDSESTACESRGLCFVVRRNSLAGLLDESDGYEDSFPQEDDGQENDRLRHRYDYH